MPIHDRGALGVSAVLALIVHAATAHAQGASCPEAGPGPAVEVSGALRQLPVDRISDLLALVPGVTSLDQGDLSVRGSGTDALAIYLDGVPVRPGHRRGAALLGGSYFGDQGAGLGLGTNGFDRLRLYRGPSPAEFGGGRGGVVALATEGRCAPPGPLTGSVASDALFGTTHTLGFNRLTLAGSGSLGRLRLRGAAVAEGLESVRLGMDQNASPIYEARGVDTTVTFNPGPQNVTVDVLSFRASKGIRIPHSANGSYSLNGRAGYDLGGGHEAALSFFESQRQNRQFDYLNFYNPAQTFADRASTGGVTAGWSGPLRRSGALLLRGEVALSYQADRVINSPLSRSGERDTRDPFGGFLFAPVDFRFDFDNFAVNDELVRNFRTNSGRRSPYDLNNTSQYQLVDQYRNNAYGLQAFTESGGPVGLLTLSRESRVVGKGVLDATRGALQLRLGGEFTRYDVNFYESQLTSQLNSNAYVESPKSSAFFLDGVYRLAQVTIETGIRLEHFSSGASRPAFPRISSSPGFDPANPTAGFVADDGHSRVSPRVRATVEATPGLTITGGIGALAQQPDFALVFNGINTDLSVTSPSTVFGTDLDYEHAVVYDLGGRYRIAGGWSLEGAIAHREDKDLARTVLSTEPDPLRGTTVDIFRIENGGSGKATSIEVSLRKVFAARGQAWIGYTWVDATRTVPAFSLNPSTTTAPAADSRPSTLAGAVLYQTAPDSRLAGGLLRNTGIYGAVRIASGTAYTGCDPNDPSNVSVLSGQGCAGLIAGDVNNERLPSLKLVDLRLTRGFAIGRTTLTAFADARNLLNTRVVTRVFAATGKTSNAAERLLSRNSSLAEYANEAAGNGVRQADGTIDLSFGGAADPRAACGSWTNGGRLSVPNCIYLINAEARWGNGDHLFTTAEQTRASDAFYNVSRGLQNFTGPGRRVRIGLELAL